MRGNDVIYPGPARIVLAAASQLRDTELSERHGEEWLANLRHRTYVQQWRDAISLLVRGAQATRYVYDGTNNARPRVVVAGQWTMALVLVAGTILLFSTSQLSASTSKPSIVIPLTLGSTGTFLLLTAASAITLAMLSTLSWRAVLGGLTVGTLGTVYIVSQLFSVIIKLVSPTGMLQITYIASWWAVTAALAVFASSNTHSVIRLLAATEVVAVLRHSWWFYPDWIFTLVRPLDHFLNSITFGRITASEMVPGRLFKTLSKMKNESLRE